MKRFFIFSLLPLVVQADIQCPVDTLASYTWGSEISDNYVHVDADNAKMTPEWVNLQGSVVAKRGQEVFYTEKVDYQRQKQQLITKAEMTYGRPDFALRSKGADYSLINQLGMFDNVEYYVKKQKANGRAATLKVNRKDQIEELTGATYTTCNRLNPNWFLQAKKLHLNHKADIGTAKHVTFRIADVPVMYLPYFSFPLSNKRKTGFLIPRAGSNSSRGIELTIPFYINIASNQDATIYPRLMSKRGLMLGAEYRYLLPYLDGIVSGSYLPKDMKDKTKRWAFKTKHTYQPNKQSTVQTLYQRVSDTSYVKDFIGNLDLSDDKFLPSYVKAKYRLTPNYTIDAEAKHYQLVDDDYKEADRPYDILPRVSGRGSWPLGNGLSISSDTEVINFDKDKLVSGVRFDEKVKLTYDVANSYSFVKPSAAYRFTSYSLRDQAKTKPDSIQRSIPTFSLDTGLYFDRQTTWLGRDVAQSLEPRLFYLYTPYENQADIPDFDTADISSSYGAMFLDNRFSGKDRIGDANQLTTAVSTTFTDNDSGQELAKFSVGQIQYFQDRKVSLNRSVADASRSNVIAEARARLTDNIKVRGLLHRNIDTHNTEKSIFGLTYQPATDQSINLSHLYDEDNYKQIDFSGVWRLNDAWRGFWRWHYSAEYNKSIDTLAGVEYAECCWAVRLLARRKRDSVTSKEKPNNSVYLEFVLNGLGNLGNSVGSTLEEVIPNYRPISYERKK
ncbi:MAG: hypothetical protein CR975_03920 [Gammaproteobacteria bacterium]|nr:MAG: hypothetical protein CR975_03920 [Gammaproteobacteria bacterium]